MVIREACPEYESDRYKKIEHLLCERISLRGICRAVGVSLMWLLHFMVERFTAYPEHLHVRLPAGLTDVVLQRLEAEADEMWSFVGKKTNKQWIWIAMDAKTRQVIAFHVGDQSGKWSAAVGQGPRRVSTAGGIPHGFI